MSKLPKRANSSFFGSRMQMLHCSITSLPIVKQQLFLRFLGKIMELSGSGQQMQAILHVFIWPSQCSNLSKNLINNSQRRQMRSECSQKI